MVSMSLVIESFKGVEVKLELGNRFFMLFLWISTSSVMDEMKIIFKGQSGCLYCIIARNS